MSGQSRHRWAPRRAPAPVVLPVPVDPEGILGPTRAQSRGPAWRTTSRGLFVPAHVPETPAEQRIAETAPLAGDAGAVTGWASLRLQGGGFFDGLEVDGRTPRPVLLVVPGQSRRKRSGVVFLDHRLDACEVVVIQGIRCTVARRALFDEMRMAADRREAVVAMDMAAAARIISVLRMQTYVQDKARWQGVAQVRWALVLADEDSRSPQETRLRLVWVLDAGLPTPLVNRPIFDRSGRLIGYPDLLDVDAGLVAEYDGDDHRSSVRHSSDVDREDLFRRHRMEVTRFTGADTKAPSKVVQRLLSARDRALWVPPAQRSWTTQPPPGFQEELPLDVELDLLGEPE